jgi:hypothetical protein
VTSAVILPRESRSVPVSLLCSTFLEVKARLEQQLHVISTIMAFGIYSDCKAGIMPMFAGREPEKALLLRDLYIRMRVSQRSNS